MAKHHAHDINIKKIDRLSPTRVRLTVEFAAADVLKHERDTANRYLSQAKIPGFRPGKAPIKMVTEKFKDDILKDVVQHLVEAGFHEAVLKSKLDPVNRPNLKFDPRTLGEDKPFEFHAEFEVQPEIELKNYKGVPLTPEDTEVKDEEVQKTLDNIRERLASLEPLEGKKPENGNFVVAEVGYVVAGEEDKKQEPRPFTVELGAGRLLPELEKSLLGMEVGGEFQKVEATFPDDYDDKELAGKKATFDVKILELKRKNLPEVNEEFAGQVRPGGSVEDLMKEIRESIATSKKDEARRSARAQVVDFLIANHSFEVPASMIDKQMMNLLQFMAEDMQKRGQKMGPMKDEEMQMVKKRAEQMVRSSMLLREVASKENMTVDMEKMREKIEELSAQVKKSPEETERLLETNGMLDRLRDDVLTDQVFDFLIGNAQRVDNAPKP